MDLKCLFKHKYTQEELDMQPEERPQHRLLNLYRREAKPFQQITFKAVAKYCPDCHEINWINQDWS